MIKGFISLQERPIKNPRLRFIASYDDDDDYYSPTDWDQQPDESDTDYEERSEDLNDWLEYNS